MDRFTPASSLRTGRPLTRTRPRARPMSPSPRPHHHGRRSFAESANSVFIANPDYDYLATSPLDADLDLVFNMSPVHMTFGPPPPADSKPVNVMTLRNKTPTKTASHPPLASLLYSFPQPSRLHPFMGSTNTKAKRDYNIVSRPLTAVSQNVSSRFPSIDQRVRNVDGDDASIGMGVPVLSDSLLGHSPTPPSSKLGTKSSTASSFSSASRSRSHTHTSSASPSSPTRLHSSPIPIPHHTPRQSDPGVYNVDSLASSFIDRDSEMPLSPLDMCVTPIPIPSSGLNVNSYTNGSLAYSYPAPAQVEFESPGRESEPHLTPITLDISINLDASPIHDHDAFYEETSIRDAVPIPESPTPMYLNAGTFSSSGSASSPFRFSRFLSTPHTDTARSSPGSEIAVIGFGSCEPSLTTSSSGQSAIVMLRRFAGGVSALSKRRNTSPGKREEKDGST